MNLLVCDELQAELQKHGVKPVGHQTLGEPATRVTSRDFLATLLLGGYAPTSIGFAQVKVPEDVTVNAHAWNTYFYFFPGKVIAASTRHTTHKHVQKGDGWIPGKDDQSPEAWGHVVRFYVVGCAHPNLKRHQRHMSEYELVCADCGYNQSFDSSN